MKKRFTVLLICLLLGLAPAVQADMELYVADDTISAAQARMLAQLLSDELGEEVLVTMQEETGVDFAARMLSGDAPQLAVVKAHQVRTWAAEGMVLALNGAVDVRQLAQEAASACLNGDDIVLAPLFVRRRMLAVHPAKLEAARIGYLLDERAHPVWYPSQFVQMLDELALLGTPGMELWPQTEAGMTATEALLQSVSGVEPAALPDGELLTDALVFLDDMVRAGLIGPVKSREEALERFLSGETAIFADWSDQETMIYKEELEQTGIVLRPYPALDGVCRHAWELIGVCAIKGSEEERLLMRAAELLCSDSRAVRIFGQRALARDGALWLPAMDAFAGGATLRAMLLDAAKGILAGDVDPDEASGRIMRALEALEN